MVSLPILGFFNLMFSRLTCDNKNDRIPFFYGYIVFSYVYLPNVPTHVATDRNELLCNVIHNSRDTKCKFLATKSNGTPEKRWTVTASLGSSSQLYKAWGIFWPIL